MIDTTAITVNAARRARGVASLSDQSSLITTAQTRAQGRVSIQDTAVVTTDGRRLRPGASTLPVIASVTALAVSRYTALAPRIASRAVLMALANRLRVGQSPISDTTALTALARAYKPVQASLVDATIPDCHGRTFGHWRGIPGLADCPRRPGPASRCRACASGLHDTARGCRSAQAPG